VINLDNEIYSQNHLISPVCQHWKFSQNFDQKGNNLVNLTQVTALVF
jgi:hypothetical protein